MGSEYDHKFEEMKKYIPFLESMIKRLESTSTSSSNPRQAQLDKIRSLRDLLLDKKKRMKMDNLLKCEQVLVNLYAKVEQKDTLPVVQTEKMDSNRDSSDLEAVRNKLKTVVKMQNVVETLPEIARASEIEEICEPGSKEPALFQRRPNRSSLSPPKQSPKKTQETKISPKSQSRRTQYTRVLVSPPRSSRWLNNEDTSADKQLFSRRSPRKSPRRSSPSYHKKERKKPSKSKEGKSRKDLNITLKVPEESLHSLNTEDILSRIINCSDGDVDIDTLRELRSQILGELKQTGTNDDISELILKSYSKKSKSNKKKRKPEVEEGEISDSESEIIENVYGSLVVMDKGKKPGQPKTATEKSNQQRKIQICLVINSDKEGETKPVTQIDLSKLEPSEGSKDIICIESDPSPSPNKKDKPQMKESENELSIDNVENTKGDISKENSLDNKSDPIDHLDSPKKKESPKKNQETPNNMLYSPSEILKSPSPPTLQDDKPKEPTQNIANFYKPHPESTESIQSDADSCKPDTPTTEPQKSENSSNSATPDPPIKEQDNVKKDDFTEIPLLNEPTLPPKAKKDVLSEIDILQALKNEILSGTIPMAAVEADTPALHQPKLSKVASAAEASTSVLQPKPVTNLPISNSRTEISKKRISIENYKKKSVTVAKSLFVKKRSNAEREAMKKQSLKLTEKECERFNFPARLSLDDDTDDISDDDLLDDDKPLSLNDIYANLAPKSPDEDHFSDEIDDTPVVIPVDPVKSPGFASKTDVDLRMPNAPQTVPPSISFTNFSPSLSTDIPKPPVFEPKKVIPDGNRKPLVDPRLRRELSQQPRDSPNPYGATNIEGTPRPAQFPNIPTLLGPIFTPSYTPSMTPVRTPNARTFEMTPSHQSFEIDEPQQKHVYAPSFSMGDNYDLPVAKNKSIWEPNNSNDDQRSGRDTRKPRWEPAKGSTQREPLLRDPPPLLREPLFNQRKDKYHVDRRDGYTKSDCPPTPIPSFGWSDSSSVPPLLETPMTPSHPFGRSDCPPTPSHPFGRSDCPPTPNHPFGRSECPPTPIHPFGRSECPSTPSHPFGRADYKDPRINRRQSDYDPRMQHDDRDRGFHNERGYNRSNSYNTHNRSYDGSDSPHNYDREQQYGRNDRYSNEHGNRYSKNNYPERPPRYERARSIGRSDKSYYNESSDRGRRENSQNRALPREDTGQLYTRNRDGYYDSKYSDSNEEIGSRRNRRERSIGRDMPSESIRARDQSINRTELDNSLSVKPQKGRAFTIDTSVNSTFQNLIESGKGIQVFDYTFDARRQRAASVGRSLVRESSVARTLSHGTKLKETQSTEPCFQRRNNFQRASSVGRSLITDKKEKSFQEIKAELKSYRSDSSKSTSIQKPVSKKTNIDSKTFKPESRSRKDEFEKFGRASKHDAKQPYSPKKNNRDPRNNKNERSNRYSLDRRHSGISYSNDNIAKGTTMKTGFGVKNYKIPKIKRPEPELPKTPIENIVKESVKSQTSTTKLDADKNKKTTEKNNTNKNSDDEMSLKIINKSIADKKNRVEKYNEKKDKGNLSDEGTKNKIKMSKPNDNKVTVISDDDSEKRITRSSKRSDNLKEELNKKTKRIRKPVFDDSDSDDETDLKTLNEKGKLKSIQSVIKDSEVPKKQKSNDAPNQVVTQMEESKNTKAVVKKVSENPTQKLNTEKSTAEKELRKTLEDSDSSFGIDDLEIFNDNIASDPVIDNINDLIANLDSDIGTVKSANDSFTSEMEKMIGAIDSQEENTLGDISDLIEKDLNESNEQLKQILTQNDDNVLNEVELFADPKKTSTPVPTKVVSQTKSNVEVAPKSIDSATESAVPEKNNYSKVLEGKISEQKASNGSLTASNDETVSTTQIDQMNIVAEPIDIGIENKTFQNTDTADKSAPDSTIVQNDDVPDKLQASLPDSTMEIHSEISSDVTSTLNDAEKSSKETSEPSQSRKEVSAIDSFGSLLSILQDKSKIKELLSMLGEQSGETEKIKKKLEKLSEIVSDEEDDNDDQSRVKQSKESEKTLHCSQSSKVSNQISGPQKVAQEINESIELSPSDIIDETVKEPNAEKNKEAFIKDVQPDKKEKAECSQVPVEDKKLANNNEELPDVAQMSDDETNDEPNDDIESNENQNEEVNEKIEKTAPKKNKVIKRGKKGRRGKVNLKRAKPQEVKSPEFKPKPRKKRTNRELYSLQNDIKEMFMCEDVLNVTSIRMCRLAKMTDKKDETDSPPKENEPVVLIEKYKGTENAEEPPKKIRKKPGPKPKLKVLTEPTAKRDKSADKEDKTDKTKNTYKPGPKSKTRQKLETKDPYEFDTDSVADTNTTKDSDVNSSDSENESIVSNESFGSSEALADIKKKPKKKRCSWQSGVIKPRHKKKKEQDSSNSQEETKVLPKPVVTIPDLNCFTDKTYCFQRGVFTYDCRLCHYSGTEIVNHYKKQHAHTEVPLSRMDPDTAKKAIQQCEEINFQAISKMPSEKYICRFCYKEFSKIRVALETFFWHVVSTHTGEYKHLCYECVNFTRCPFNLDIPPPPKEIKGQLIGYICGKCNFTQISLENLKTHVIVRHNDEQTEVYTINLGAMSQKAMKAMLRKSLTEEHQPRTLRSSRSNQSAVEGSELTDSDRLSDVGSAVPKIEEPDPHVDAAIAEMKRRKPGPMKSKITFETDDQERSDQSSVKVENEPESDYPIEPPQLDDTFNDTEPLNGTHNETSELVSRSHPDETFSESAIDHSNVDVTQNNKAISENVKSERATDVFEKPHFKLNYKESGAKEYVCCVSGFDNHYKTTLLISLKKHVQTKHTENWDGFCCVCKVIVTLQGVQSSFKDCLAHFLDKHMDDFPVLEKVVENVNEDSRSSLRSSIDGSIERTESPRIFVRPLSDLITKDVEVDPPLCDNSESPFPIIENVVSLGDKTVEVPQASHVYPSTSTEIATSPSKPFLYEEVQAEVMSKKHRIVLDSMMPKELLVRVFKCSGRFCSFTSDSAEDSLVHASAHKQLGGEGALDCAYCNFDAAGNAIDLVMHVFKEHGRCQFSCSMCFYRAAADQLVIAHFTKAHATAVKASKVIRTTSGLASSVPDLSNMLSRETAVPYYICNHGGGSCKYRTYTPGKFCEHLQQKHESELEHPCSLCEVTMPTPTDLVKHMKNHGIKLYQCTWCVYGANYESEMLSHAASLHPTKNPQAYLRIITNKEGSTEKRVLPLIYLNKLKEPVEDVTPSKVKENPTREAERSIELEKLITHTTLMIETQANVSDPVPETPVISETPEVIAEPSDVADEITAQAIEKSLLSSPEKPPQAVIEPVPVKNETEEEPTFNQRTDNVVYCLDSDEEDALKIVEDTTPKPAVIDLSDEEPNKSEPSMLKQLVAQPVQTPILRQLVAEPTQKTSDKPKFKKLPIEVLFKCPNCQQNFRNVGGFKKHTNSCCADLVTMECPHVPCPIILSSITQLINHYNKDHNALNINKIYHCGECKSRWSTLNVTKKHLKDAHGITKVVITSKLEDDGSCLFTIHKESKAFDKPKKYGIEDIDKLPINPIMDSLVYCNICEFSTKVRLNMVRHLQLHAERQPVPQTAPVNPVPHLENNEKHFDKMVNLASSSAAARADKLPAVSPEAIGRYPKYVPDRQRHTCGAKGCSYISVDEGMLRCHWETLHSGALDYHCAHCPPHQQLDTTKLLTASRIIAHLKMHDASLYACSACAYYHHKKQIVEKHVTENHKDKNAHVLIVREEGILNPASQAPSGVGTMDLKPWQCGLCQYKSMLRRDLIEHCSKHHNTKMQYKCSYCPFRTSDVENITKHQSNAHPSKAEDVFYYYYREGDVPNEADGTPRWRRQSQKYGAQEIVPKTEQVNSSTKSDPPMQLDLNLVKKEVEDQTAKKALSIEELCDMYGQFCDPNGISFKCPLCKTAVEFNREAMQSHLYEELNYRRWSCAICMYKAYHRAGLNEHITSEHNRNFAEPTELPVNPYIEKWVSELLDHQTAIIDKNKVPKTTEQKIATEKPIPGPSKAVEPPTTDASSDTELEQAFGSLGSPKEDCFCCPKCNITIKDEDEMRNHLESELTKIRWCCTKCTNKFPTFHEAQFHCKSHPGPLSRPKEAIRDPSLRSAWVSFVLHTQKKTMKPSTQQMESPERECENSLLVVRYEEAAPTEEQQRQIAREDYLNEMARKRPVDSDSEDEDNLVIYEPENKKINDRNCPYCDFVSKSNHQYKLCMREHILRHYNLKILTCNFCPFNSNRKMMYQHLQEEHPGRPMLWKQTEIPNVLPSEYNLKSSRKTEKRLERKDEKYKVCLHCEASVPEHSLITHLHGHRPSEFGNRGDVVVKCCICLTLTPNLETMQDHYTTVHPDISKPNYAYYTLQIDTREVQSCGICKRRFTFLRDLRIHHSAMHGTFNLSYSTVPYRPEDDHHELRGKRKLEDASPTKHVAKKSTSKLPFSNIAKKSTTKLPETVDDEYSYYGTKPPSFNQFENIKTMMPMYNTMVEIDVKKLSGIIKIDPKVVVKDFRQPFAN